MTDPVPVNGTIELDGHQFRHRKDLSCRYVFISSKAAPVPRLSFWRAFRKVGTHGVELCRSLRAATSGRFPFIAMAIDKLPVRSCLIDGEAIVCDEKGVAVFELIRRRGALASAVHCAVDLLELDGKDLRRQPIEERKQLLAKLLRGSNLSIVLNETFEEDGAIVFREACKLGCEGIVSKRLGSPYRPGRSAHWVKVKNPKAPAVKREAEEDWGY
jgi:bifunctional non-homologous end joining protein LigD